MNFMTNFIKSDYINSFKICLFWVFSISLNNICREFSKFKERKSYCFSVLSSCSEKAFIQKIIIFHVFPTSEVIGFLFGILLFLLRFIFQYILIQNRCLFRMMSKQHRNPNVSFSSPYGFQILGT